TGEPPRFTRVPSTVEAMPSPTTLGALAHGEVWVGTDDGVYAARGGRLQPEPPALPRRIWDDHFVEALAETPAGRWIGTLDALWRCPSGEAPLRYEAPGRAGPARVTSLLRDRGGRFWIATWN